MSSRIDRHERRWVVLIILLQIAAISLPYLWVANTGPDNAIYGGLLYNPDDQNVHLAWSRQAAQGAFFFRDLFTTESLIRGDPPVFTNVFCWLMGTVSAVTRAPLVWVYHAFRVVFAGLALYWFYRLCCVLTPRGDIRVVAVALAAFSCGTGWLKGVYGLIPSRVLVDLPDGGLMMPEAFTFTSAFVFPLNIASIALLSLVYWWTLRSQQLSSPRLALAAGVAAAALSNIHTYDALPLIAVLVLWAGACALRTTAAEHSQRRFAIAAPLVVAALALLPVLVQLLVFQRSEEFRIKASTPTPPPPPADLMLTYGMLLVAAAAGVGAAWKGAGSLALLWLCVTALMIYLPPSLIPFSRKMIEGAHLPLCFLAASALVTLTRRIRHPFAAGGIIGGFVVLCSISSFRFVDWCLNNAINNNLEPRRAGAFMPPLYLPAGDMAALQYLERLRDYRGVLLCLPYIGNYAPRETGRHVYVGHWAETIRFYDPATRSGKIVEVQKFYGGGMTRTEALAFLERNRISHVLEGQYEKNLFPLQSTPQQLGLKPVFEHSGSVLHEVPAPVAARP